MPAGSPPGGLDRRFLLGLKLMNQFGSDTSVNFQVVARDNINGNIMIGGNNDYVGLVSDGIYAQPIQGAVLPPSSNTWDRACHNFTDRGWLLLDTTGQVFRMNAGLTSTLTITPPAAVTRSGIVEFNGRIFIHTNALAGPARDLEISDDNGATWDSDPGLFTGQGSNGNGIFTNFNQNRLLAIFNGGADFATTVVPDGASGWTFFPAGNAGVNMNAGSISDDGTNFCVVSNNGGVATQAGIIPPANNPWQSSPASGFGFDIVQWVQALNGFFVISTVGAHCGFVDAASPDRVIPGSQTAIALSLSDQCSISDGEQMLCPSSGNGAIISLRNIGQTGINA